MSEFLLFEAALTDDTMRNIPPNATTKFPTAPIMPYALNAPLVDSPNEYTSTVVSFQTGSYAV